MVPALRAFALALALMVAGPASAATIVARDVPYLTEASDLIAHGTVSAITHHMGDDGRPYTVSTLEVRACWKGACGDALDITQLGGPFQDGRVMHIDGDLDLAKGMELVIFLRKGDDGNLYSTLLGWSAFEVRHSTFLRRHQSEFGLMMWDSEGRMSTAEPSQVPRPPKTLDQLRAAVRSEEG